MRIILPIKTKNIDSLLTIFSEPIICQNDKVKMWHEARRQERKIRGMLVDYRKRAERRRDYYEKIKADPTQFLQVHGRLCKVHLDPAIAAAADSAVMMPWQGNENNLIDRFDVRAHLDYILPVKKEEEHELTQEERHLNYERYRIIAQNAYLGISEEKFLKQLHLEEQFGYTEMKSKKEPKGVGAAIGFNYEEGTAIIAPPPSTESPEESFEDDNSDSDLDVDLAINVSKIDSAQAHEMNKHGQQFGMFGNDFYSFLTDDMEEAESYKLAKEEEHEKALFSGRKSRRERRAHREKRLANRKISPPSYAAKESPTNPSFRDDSKSPSRSPSPDAGKITYITSFGDDEETPTRSKSTYADKVRYGKSKKQDTNSDRIVYFEKNEKKSQSCSSEVSYDQRSSKSNIKRSRSRSRSRRSRSRNRRSRSRSRSKKTARSFSKEKSRSPTPQAKRRRSKSRSGSRSEKNRRSYSTSRSRSRSQKSVSRKVTSRSRSRSRSLNERSKSRSYSRSLSRSERSRSRSRQRGSKSYRRRSLSSSSLSSSTCSSKSRSKSGSPVLKRNKSKSKSLEAPSPPRIVPRYYGRKRSDLSSSESSSSDEEANQDEPGPAFSVSSDSKYRSGNNSGTVSKKPTTTLTVIERLKLKRQALINRQFKKDKIAEVQKLEREKQEQQTREDELREMAIKLRRRQREKRHAYDRSSSSDSDKSNVSKKKEKSPSPKSKEKDSTKSERDRRERDKRSRSKDRSRRSERSRSKDRNRRSRSRSRRRYDRNRDERGGKRDRSSEYKEVFKKLVDY